MLIKTNAPGGRGDLYSARRFLNQHAPTSNDRDMLSRWANLEDWYGSEAPEAYSRLLNTLLRENAPKEEILEICRRGLQVGLRDERFGAARRFAAKSADLGDPSGLELLESNASAAPDRVTIPGGVAALHFLLIGKGKPNLQHFLVDYTRVLTSIAINTDGREFRSVAQTVHRYFQQLSALAEIGTRRNGDIDILLTVNDEQGEQRTRAVLGILGLKLARSDPGFAIELAQGTSQAKRQDTQAALAIDEAEIQKVLSSGKSYLLEIPFDSVPVYPAEHVWQLAFGQNGDYPGGFAEILVRDPRLPRLYLALNSMDRRAAEALLKAVPLRTLAERYSRPLSLFSTSFALNNDGAEVPGGAAADSAWQQLVGESPSNPAPFFLSLLNRDDGRLVAFFDAISHLDLAHQRFVTCLPDRTKRFYELFRNSPEMRGEGEGRLSSSTLLDLLREVPLNNSGTVAFPASPEVWMTAKGGSGSAAAVTKVAQKLQRAAAFTDHMEELHEITTDRDASTTALTQLRAEGRTALFDSIAQLALDLEKRPGKKAILVLTDGSDNVSVLNREAAVASARKAGVPIFAVAEGEALHDNAAADLLRDLAEATGGRMYKANRSKEIETVFQAIGRYLQNGYLLAFQAPLEAKATPWHELHVMVKNTPEPLNVRARTSYSIE